MNIENFLRSANESLLRPALSAAKALLKSRRPSAAVKNAPRPLIIMGNGPSLRSFLDFEAADPTIRERFDLEAVNFAAITPEFTRLKPELYVLADPHFFTPTKPDPRVDLLWENIAKCDWPMTLWLPLSIRKRIAGRLSVIPSCVTLKWMNLTPVEGRGPIADMLIDAGLGMPRPRNVLIPAIMTAMRSGYSRIFLTGADHSWSRSLWVDDANRVVSVQPHFYRDDEKERQRVEAEYAGYHLHDILDSLRIAFKSYFDISRHASRHGVMIYNATPESFIDAFPRCDYAQMTTLSAQ
ncbi:MAG: hypothetical protein K2L83_03435 [Muribaculaceae bacterium]|nr:hypothetical protein [Muribaculaceae bacterium]